MTGWLFEPIIIQLLPLCVVFLLKIKLCIRENFYKNKPSLSSLSTPLLVLVYTCADFNKFYIYLYYVYEYTTLFNKSIHYIVLYL